DLGGAALVGVDVGGLGADDRLPVGGHRAQRDDVGGGAVEDRPGPRPLAEVAPEHVLQRLGVDVVAVGGLVAAVGVGDGLEDLGVHAGVVVAGEALEPGVVPDGHVVRSNLVPLSWSA